MKKIIIDIFVICLTVSVYGQNYGENNEDFNNFKKGEKENSVATSLKGNNQVKALLHDLDYSVNAVNLLKSKIPALKGTGVIISVKDNFYDTTDIDLLNKHIDIGLNAAVIDNHATVMATIIAGRGNSSLKGLGVAPGAFLATSDYNNLYPDSVFSTGSYTVNIQNHSYGTDIENFYGSYAEKYDEHILKHPWQIHIFSAGNKGTEVCPDGPYKGIPGVGNLTGNYKMAKNNLVVGAVDLSLNSLNISSGGPTYDGRVKPEVVAYSNTGTSNAAALVSGICALLTEEYKNYFGSIPSAELLKSVLINSSKDIGNTGPDYRTGYGNVNAYRSWKSLVDTCFIMDSLEENETKYYTIAIPENTEKLKVTLVWTDIPAPVSSEKALQNDLDLRLLDPDSNEILPWILNTEPDIHKLSQPAIRGEDHINNIEQVSIQAPSPGNHIIEVKGFKLFSQNQHYAIAYQLTESNNFTWLQPLNGEIIALDGKLEVPIRWESTKSAKSGQLYISYDEGISWLLLNNELDLEKGFIMLNPLNLSIGKALFKIIIDEEEIYSGTFIFENTTNLDLSLNCDEQIELSWRNQPDATSYNILNLQNDSMLTVKSTTDTSITFRENDYINPYFAVCPVYNNIKGYQSTVVDISSYEPLCYFRLFSAIPDNLSNSVDLQVEFSSLYAVEQFQLLSYNNVSASFNIIEEYAPVKLINTFNDQNTNEGRNRYVAQILLEDGKVYRTDTIDTYMLLDKNFIVYPNPATTDGINVYTNTQPGQKLSFSIYSMEGKILLSKEIYSERDYIRLNEFQKGMYYCLLESTPGNFEVFKLIIN